MAAFDIKQTVKLTQQLLMTPQLQQAIKLLQLSRVELEEFVEQQLFENPVLEEDAPPSREELLQTEKEKEVSETQIIDKHMEQAGQMMDSMSGDTNNTDVDWESYTHYQDTAPPIPSTVVRNDEDFPNYENIVTKTKSLNDFLMQQLGELDLSDTEQRIALQIIGNLDERGYLRSTVQELSETEGFALELVEDLLDTIQRLEPAGVGARDLKECLLIQLRNNKLKNGIVELIVQNHLSDLETRNYAVIVKTLKISLEQVIENVQIIGSLEPVPGRQFGADAAQYIIPDVYVFQVSGVWTIAMNEDGLPRLNVSKSYRDLLDNSTSGSSSTTKSINSAEKEYIQEKLKSASWLIRSIQQRQRTIYRVTECIVKRQTEFFDKGINYLKPMVLKDIADDIEMHESTISRVTTNKYVHTPRGIFELKYFFNSSVACADGSNVASESVKTMISEIVKSENPKKPHSDQTIVELLEEKGIQLARRTVAKYREQLNILPSSKRKKLF